jgi:uncharacterized protein YegP (UPF0339 family)
MSEHHPFFDIFTGADGRHYWRLVGGNGEIMAQSQGYASASNAARSIARLKEIVKLMPDVDEEEAPDDDRQ